MIKIIFISESSNMSLKDQLEKLSFQTLNNDGIWKTIQSTASIEEADYFIFLEHFPKEFQDKIDISRIIYFQCEPSFLHKVEIEKKLIQKSIENLENANNDVFNKEEIRKFQKSGLNLSECKREIIYWAKRSIKEVSERQEPIFKNKNNFFAYFDYNNYRQPTFWRSRISFKELNSNSYNFKSKSLSCIMSTKVNNVISGYSKRINFLERFIQKYENYIEIYGFGTENKIHSAYKGPLKYNKLCNAKAFINYKYTFLCENCIEKGHISDRINDCILNWSIPIYWGTLDIYKYYPKDAVYTIDIENDSIDKLYEISQKPITVKNIKALAEARQLILHKYNIWEKVYQTIENE